MAMGLSPERIMERVEFDPFGGCWLWSGCTNHNGYGSLKVCGKTILAHRASYAVFVGPVEPCVNMMTGQVIMHTCDVRPCVNPAHLRLGTQTENTKDRHNKGRSSRAMGRRGGASSRAILRETDVIAIKRALLGGAGTRETARVYGVSPSTIDLIKHEKNWKHINV